MSDGRALPVVADLAPLENALGHSPVIGDRDARRGPIAKRPESDAIVGTSADEIGDELLRHGEPIARPEVFGRHAAGGVESDDDIDAETIAGGDANDTLRP